MLNTSGGLTTMRLDGHMALITGGSRRLSLAIAPALAAVTRVAAGTFAGIASIWTPGAGPVAEG